MRFPIRPWIFNRNGHRLMRCSLILMIGVLMIGNMKPTPTSTSIQTLTGIGHQKPQSKEKTPPTKTKLKFKVIMTTTRAVSLIPITLLLRVLRLHLGKMEHRRYSELLLHAFFFDTNAHFSKGQVICTKREVDGAIQGSTGVNTREKSISREVIIRVYILDIDFGGWGR